MCRIVGLLLYEQCVQFQSRKERLSQLQVSKKPGSRIPRFYESHFIMDSDGEVDDRFAAQESEDGSEQEEEEEEEMDSGNPKKKKMMERKLAGDGQERRKKPGVIYLSR